MDPGPSSKNLKLAALIAGGMAVIVLASLFFFFNTSSEVDPPPPLAGSAEEAQMLRSALDAVRLPLQATTTVGTASLEEAKTIPFTYEGS